MWRIGFVIAAFLLPPILGLVCVVRPWKHQSFPKGLRLRSPFVLGILVLANWILLIFFAQQQIRAGSYQDIPRWPEILLFMSLFSVVASGLAHALRVPLLIANMLLLGLWFCFGYAPEHWLGRADFGEVSVDDHPIPATTYIGNPTQSEAEAIALVQVPGVGNYFVNFEEETFREASSREFIQFHFGVWTWKRMGQGHFRPPLRFLHVNECRIPLSAGGVLTVNF